jgi:hypothetical protein
MEKISLEEDQQRIIANKTRNVCIAQEINSHQSTQIALSGLLQPFSQELENALIQ